MPDLSSGASGEPQTAAQRFVTFRVADHHYALAAEEVAEIIRMPAIARVPQSPKALLGLAHFRGSVLPVASVRRLLGREEQDAKDHARAIILDGGSPVALAVDAVESLACGCNPCRCRAPHRTLPTTTLPKSNDLLNFLSPWR